MKSCNEINKAEFVFNTCYNLISITLTPLNTLDPAVRFTYQQLICYFCTSSAECLFLFSSPTLITGRFGYIATFQYFSDTPASRCCHIVPRRHCSKETLFQGRTLFQERILIQGDIPYAFCLLGAGNQRRKEPPQH